MKKIFLLFFTILSVLLSSQNINFFEVSKEISKLNRAGKYVESQKKLTYLITKNPTDTEKANLLLLLAQTYRSINDYNAAIKYLKEAEANSENASQKTRNEIQAEFAFVYFDSNHYDEAQKIMTKIALGNYEDLQVIDKAYIIMQQGYVSFLKNDYHSAEEKYNASIALMKKNSPCDLPVVNAKQIELFGKMDRLSDAEKLYHQSMGIADSCKILKYELYLTDEFKKVLVKTKSPKVYFYANKLDSLTYMFDRNNKLSKMYMENIEKEKESLEKLQKTDYTKTIIYIISSILLLIIIYIITKKSRKTHAEKQKIEAELQKMKDELSNYIHQVHPKPNSKTDLNFDKLTERQIELINYLEKGYSNREIAEKMFITEATVKYHIKNIYEVLELKNRKEFLAKANRNS